MEITKREIVASIAIAAIMLTIGFVISDKITDSQNDWNAEYRKAVHIEDSELFLYGMETNVGNAFVYGNIEPVDTVTFEEIGGEYLYIKRVKEKYSEHTRTVTYTTGSGETKQTHTKTATYWTWDEVETIEKECDKVLFCGVVFDSIKIALPSDKYIATVKGSSKIRYKYYGVSTNHIGTIYTRLADGTISDGSQFYEDCTIDQALERCTAGTGIVLFWIGWILFTAVCVYRFCYLDNRWLEG